MIKVIPFRKAHLNEFRDRELFKQAQKEMKELQSKGNTDVLSLFRDGLLVSFVGVTHKNSGTGEVWLIPTERVNKLKFEFFKAMHNLIDRVGFDLMGLHRIEMAVIVDNKQHIKFAEKLGFVREGIMRAYDYNRKDHYLYARIS